jgi:hypothetical protein
MAGDTTLLILLAKTVLNMREKADVSVNVNAAAYFLGNEDIAANTSE